jgi:oxygen-independent coproporphyrinogen-3 oxidase
MELNDDDSVRREIIQDLMCHFELTKARLNAEFNIDFDSYFATELTELHEYELEGLLVLTADKITVTPKGRMLIRNICMIFDHYLRTRQKTSNYSKVI